MYINVYTTTTCCSIATNERRDAEDNEQSWSATPRRKCHMLTEWRDSKPEVERHRKQRPWRWRTAYLAIDADGDLVRTEDALHGRRRRQRLDSGDWIGCMRVKRDDHETTVDVSIQHLNIKHTYIYIVECVKYCVWCNCTEICIST